MVIKKVRLVTIKILKLICCLFENIFIVFVYFVNIFIFYYKNWVFYFFYRYIKFLVKEDDENLISFCTVIGDFEVLVEFFCVRG